MKTKLLTIILLVFATVVWGKKNGNQVNNSQENNSQVNSSSTEKDLIWLNVKSTLWLNEDIYVNDAKIYYKNEKETISIEWKNIKDIVMTKEGYNNVITIIDQKELGSKECEKKIYWKQCVVKLTFKRNIIEDKRHDFLNRIRKFAESKGAVLID